jgi:hydrogenase maturation protein HypF
MTTTPKIARRNTAIKRMRVSIHGAVQGVGFRPFIYRLAVELGLFGWVSNTPQGVVIEVEGKVESLAAFVLRIEPEKPPISFIQGVESSHLDPVGYADFQIRQSSSSGRRSAIVLPDIGTCPECAAEIFDPENRRFRYPFTNCTNCGPRYSIIESLPYDRPNTSMKRFAMCAECEGEYNDPADRRFHAQPNACPKCGPQLQLLDGDGDPGPAGHEALLAAARAIREGRIVAVKGIGGFHLMADAQKDCAVKELRRRKHREEKPLALMVPSISLIEELCEVSALERRALASPERPIVLLAARDRGAQISPSIAPGNPYLGCMLPYTPLHELLLDELKFPVVATSGNLSDEPICTDEIEAVERLRGVADLFLVHDRPIIRHVDDSILRIIAGREMIVRRARGFAPLPVTLKMGTGETLAVGGHQKNCIAATSGKQVFISQHIGDLDTPQATRAFTGVIDDLETLFEISPKDVVCDLHPDYMSTRYARGTGLPRIAVQHHYAHVLSCMAENEIDAPALGVAWDGTGYGDDGTVWGGEFLLIGESGFTRAAHFRTFPLPGGDKAGREPRRSALGVLYELYGDAIFESSETPPVGAFDAGERNLLRRMLATGLNCPRTSSVGRLFDAVSSIVGLRQVAGFEGQAAMELEFAIGAFKTVERYDSKLVFGQDGDHYVDWGDAMTAIRSDAASGVGLQLISARFHNMLVESIVSVARHAGEGSVVLSGGCFQNKYLLERSIERLAEEGFRPYWHQRVPTNDGGIALGQAFAAARHISAERSIKTTIERRAALCA